MKELIDKLKAEGLNRGAGNQSRGDHEEFRQIQIPLIWRGHRQVI